MAPEFDKANEIYFRLGIIYKQQAKYQQSLEVFDSANVEIDEVDANIYAVLSIHCEKSSTTLEPNRYLVPDRPCFRTAERRE